MHTASHVSQAQRRTPVLILLPHPLKLDAALTIHEAYNWIFRTTPDQVRRFQASTTLLARFGPALTDESYAVYELNAAPAAGPTS